VPLLAAACSLLFLLFALGVCDLGFSDPHYGNFTGWLLLPILNLFIAVIIAAAAARYRVLKWHPPLYFAFALAMTFPLPFTLVSVWVGALGCLLAVAELSWPDRRGWRGGAAVDSPGAAHRGP